MRPASEFKEILRKYQQKLNRKLSMLEGMPEDVVRRWVEEYRMQLYATLEVFDGIGREMHPNGEVEVICNEVTQTVQNELFPFALVYWTLLYCEKVKTL